MSPWIASKKKCKSQFQESGAIAYISFWMRKTKRINKDKRPNDGKSQKSSMDKRRDGKEAESPEAQMTRGWGSYKIRAIISSDKEKREREQARTVVSRHRSSLTEHFQQNKVKEILC